jgi:hypothetical protein
MKRKVAGMPDRIQFFALSPRHSPSISIPRPNPPRLKSGQPPRKQSSVSNGERARDEEALNQTHLDSSVHYEENNLLVSRAQCERCRSLEKKLFEERQNSQKMIEIHSKRLEEAGQSADRPFRSGN